ncbi:hypothetical protein [Paraburkholderia dipogonis]|uniref:hypothetical protein n=1 Tax=Paraburkholderia dipogonis TaxID=1211383 RepID=UPI0038BE1691
MNKISVFFGVTAFLALTSNQARCSDTAEPPNNNAEFGIFVRKNLAPPRQVSSFDFPGLAEPGLPSFSKYWSPTLEYYLTNPIRCRASWGSRGCNPFISKTFDPPSPDWSLCSLDAHAEEVGNNAYHEWSIVIKGDSFHVLIKTWGTLPGYSGVVNVYVNWSYIKVDATPEQRRIQQCKLGDSGHGTETRCIAGRVQQCRDWTSSNGKIHYVDDWHICGLNNSCDVATPSPKPAPDPLP